MDRMRHFNVNCPEGAARIAEAFRESAEARSKVAGSECGAAHAFNAAAYWYEYAASVSMGRGRAWTYHKAAELCAAAADEYYARWENDIAGPGNGN